MRNAVNFTQELISSLKKLGISIPNTCREMHLIDDIKFEPPVSLHCEIHTLNTLRVGAFTAVREGSSLKNCIIGRYCSFGQNVIIGSDQHPTNWLTTSRIGYCRPMDHWDDYLSHNGYIDLRGAKEEFNSNKITIIDNDVWIGRDCFIKCGLHIGTGAIIGAGSIVTRNVEPYSIVAGSPAKLIKYRFPERIIIELLESEWWKYSYFSMKEVKFSKIDEAIKAINNIKSNSSANEYRPTWITSNDIRELAAKQ